MATIAFAESINHGFWESRNHARGATGLQPRSFSATVVGHSFYRQGISPYCKIGSTTPADWESGIYGYGSPNVGPPWNKNFHCFQKATVTKSTALTDDAGEGIGLGDFVFGYAPYDARFYGIPQIDTYDLPSKYTGGTIVHTEVQAGDDEYIWTTSYSDSVSGTTRTEKRRSTSAVYKIEVSAGVFKYCIGDPGFGDYIADMEFEGTVVTAYSDDYSWATYLSDFKTKLFDNLPADKWTQPYTLDSSGSIVAGSGGVGGGRIATIPVWSEYHAAGALFAWQKNIYTDTVWHPSVPSARFATYKPVGSPRSAKYSCKTNGDGTPTSTTSELLRWSPDAEYQFGPSSGDVSALSSGEQKQYSAYWADAYDDVTPNYPVPA